MRSHDDLAGKKIGRWTVLRRIGRRGHDYAYLCICDCGTQREVVSGSLKSGSSTSCGCYLAELNRARCATHGRSKTPEFSAWQRMTMRCTNPNYWYFHRYGGRGIRVCARWLGHDGFANFLSDLGPRPTGYWLDRINNDGDYSPDNCRWASPTDQCRNRSSNHLLSNGDDKRTITEWAQLLGSGRKIIYQRLKRGWSEERAVTAPPMLRGGRAIRLKNNVGHLTPSTKQLTKRQLNP